MLGPEHVDGFWALVAVVLALLGLQGERIEFLAHDLAVGDAGPGAALAVGAVAGVERHDLRFDLSLDVREQCLDLLALDPGELRLDDKPGDRVEVVAEHLHAEARALDEGGAAAHEDVGDLEVLEGAEFLVILVIIVPDGLGGLGRVVGGAGRRGKEERAEHARATAGPPLGELIDRLAGVALDDGDLVHRQDREVDLEASLGACRVGKIDSVDPGKLAGVDGVAHGLGEALGLALLDGLEALDALLLGGHEVRGGTVRGRGRRVPAASGRRA